MRTLPIEAAILGMLPKQFVTNVGYLNQQISPRRHKVRALLQEGHRGTHVLQNVE